MCLSVISTIILVLMPLKTECRLFSFVLIHNVNQCMPVKGEFVQSEHAVTGSCPVY